MPETPVTREQLLASVHVLEPGDVLVVRCQADNATQETVSRLAATLREKLVDRGVECLVTTTDIAVGVARKVSEVG